MRKVLRLLCLVRVHAFDDFTFDIDDRAKWFRGRGVAFHCKRCDTWIEKKTLAGLSLLRRRVLGGLSHG